MNYPNQIYYNIISWTQIRLLVWILCQPYEVQTVSEVLLKEVRFNEKNNLVLIEWELKIDITNIDLVINFDLGM